MPTEKRVDEVEALPVVNAHNLSAERTVFTEEGNENGWISTDLTVSVSR
ncbi:hypothetical protein [Halolamina litorea]|uniref:Uncharacterized protein n=1 Tax=Halolamina litorea TaxID=1515593 RepID=A0ABD6BSE4_9EURY|nr:hypothetical protein [Halolamina litorea]